METTFISILDLSPAANILYSSDSIIDILGYSPDDVLNKSCWDYFHPEELPLAQITHVRGIEMDKASVLSYCRMRGKDGQWIGCEVVFTVVYDVIVGCISIYRRGLKSQSRAIEAPAVRRLFSTSPRDPRYHMLSHLSSKFSAPLQDSTEHHEPRAALFLNRYTRTLTIMYATEGLSDVLGISGEQLKGKSFYYCIEENCLKDAVRCLENAKANDSIAYLRFWYRDPRQDDDRDQRNREEDSAMEDAPWSEEQMDVDVPAEQAHARQDRLNQQDRDHSSASIESEPLSSTDSISPVNRTTQHQHLDVPSIESRTSSDESNAQYSHETVFGEPRDQRSSESSYSRSPSDTGSNAHGPGGLRAAVELEAVVSCTSDGLVVCLRKAAFSSAVPQPQQQGEWVPTDQGYANGLFAVPWGTEPVLPTPQQRSQQPQRLGFAPSLTPAQAYHRPLAPSTKPAPNDFMSAIRECAVFAWALTGINGSLADYGQGIPRGESQPSSGLPIWQSDSPSTRPTLGNSHVQPNPGLALDRPAFPSPSSIATGSYFSGPSSNRIRTRTSDHRPSGSSHSSSGSRTPFTRQPEGSHLIGGPKYTVDRSNTGRPPAASPSAINGVKRGHSPSMPGHEVDGVEAIFDDQRDPFTPERTSSNQEEKPFPNGFDFGFVQQKVMPPKMFNGNHHRADPPPIASNGFRDRPPRQYYDPARRDL